jgi:hypothetical protein
LDGIHEFFLGGQEAGRSRRSKKKFIKALVKLIFEVQAFGEQDCRVGVAGAGEGGYDSGFLKSGKLAIWGLLGWKIL